MRWLESSTYKLWIKSVIFIYNISLNINFTSKIKNRNSKSKNQIYNTQYEILNVKYVIPNMYYES